MKVTYLIVPAWSDQASQCRIVKREDDIDDALADYRKDDSKWKEVGIMNSLGNLVCFTGPKEHRQEFVDSIPLSAGLQFRLDAVVEAELAPAASPQRRLF